MSTRPVAAGLIGRDIEVDRFDAVMGLLGARALTAVGVESRGGAGLRGAVAAELGGRAIDRGQLHPLARLSKGETFLRREELLRVLERVGVVPGLEARDLGRPSVRDERGQVLRSERAEAELRA